MSGIRYTDDKQKIRGLGQKLKLTDDKLKPEKKDNIYTLEEILKINPDLDKISLYVEKPITIFQGLKYKNYTYEDINIFKPIEKILDINGDTRRIWHDDFKNANDALTRCIDSTPYFLTG